MSIMNNILSQIVVAAGGTVTRTGNRNGLLQDWLDALPKCRQIANFNGLSQSISTPNINLTGDFWFEIKYKIPASKTSIEGIAGFDAMQLLAFWSNGGIRLYINNTLIVSSTQAQTPLSGTIKIERVSGVVTLSINDSIVDTGNTALDFNIVSFAAISGALYFGGSLYDYKDSNGNILNIDDGFDNNPVILNSGAGSNATAINFTGATWSEVCE